MSFEDRHLVDGKYSFRDLVDPDRLGALAERFSLATGLALRIVSWPEQEVLGDTGGQPICTGYHHAQPASEDHCRMSDRQLTELLSKQQGPVVRSCGNGLVEGAAPIVVRGVHVANLFAGQVLFDQPDTAGFRRQGEAYGYDVDRYVEALEQVPVVTSEALESGLAVLSETVAMLAEQGLSAAGRRAAEQAGDSPQDQPDSGSLPDSGGLAGKGSEPSTPRAAGEQSPALEDRLLKAHILSSAASPIAAADLDGKVTYVNPAFLSLWGFDDESEVLGRSFAEFWLPAESTDEIMTTMRARGTWSGELRAKKGDGTLFDVQVSAATVCDSANKPIGLMSTATDITARKQAEQALRSSEEQQRARSDAAPEAIFPSAKGTSPSRSLAAAELCGSPEEAVGQGGTDRIDLRHSEQSPRRLRNYLASIIDSMPSVLVGVQPDGTVTLWNSEAARVTGVSGEVAVGQPLSQTFPRLAAVMEQVRQALRTGKVCTEVRQPHQEGGETRYEDVTIYPLITDGVEGAVIRLDEVTERVRIQEMMVLSEKMLSVGGLAAGMAHEINNPLAGMMQTAELLSRRLTEDLPINASAAREAGTTMEAIRSFMNARGVPKLLTRIHVAGARAADIVSNTLSFTRKMDFTLSSCYLTQLLDQSVELAASDYSLKQRCDFGRIEIVRQYESGLPPVLCEAGRITQVFFNILRNGAEAMGICEAAGRKPRFVLRVAQDQEAGMIQVEIQDNGSGMDEATRRRVFEPFFTTKPTDWGTGLGLSVSYFIVTENHSGELSVTSSPGKGSTFIVRLPTFPGFTMYDIKSDPPRE